MKKALTLIVYCLILFQSLSAQKRFTGGDIVVLRIGGVNGSNGLPSDSLLMPGGGAAFPVHIDEYAGSADSFTLVQSIDLPAIAAPNKDALFNSPSVNEGYLTLSGDGQWLTVMGYDTTLASGNIYSLTNPIPNLTTNRIIGRIKYDGTVDIFTRLRNLMPIGGKRDGATVEGVITDDGSHLWLGSNQGLKGVVYCPTGGTTANTVCVSYTEASVRTLGIFGGDLYAVGYHKKVTLVAPIGGLPVVPGENISTALKFNFNGSLADTLPFRPSQMVMFDLDANIPGYDVLYIVNYAAYSASDQYGLYKFYKNANNVWQLSGAYDYNTKEADYFGIAGNINETGNPVLYVTCGISGPSANHNRIRQIIDTATSRASYDAPMTAVLVRELANDKSHVGGLIRGIALTPQPPLAHSARQDITNN